MNFSLFHNSDGVATLSLKIFNSFKSSQFNLILRSSISKLAARGGGRRRPRYEMNSHQVGLIQLKINVKIGH